jgi:hypothetical protein
LLRREEEKAIKTMKKIKEGETPKKRLTVGRTSLGHTVDRLPASDFVVAPY